jgi:hypothetical protein
MRHVIFACPVLARPVVARAGRMVEPAATARLVASPRSLQGVAPCPGRTLGAVDMAPIAAATDDHLNPAIRVRAQKELCLRPVIMATTAAAPERRRLMAWTCAAAAAIMPLQSCLCTVSDTAPKQNCPVMIGAVPAFQSRQSLPHTTFNDRDGQIRARNGAADCPGRPQVPPAPSASLQGRVPSMHDPDNPERCGADQPTDETSAKNYGFRQSSTRFVTMLNLSLTGTAVRILQGPLNGWLVKLDQGDEVSLFGLVAIPVDCWVVARDRDILRLRFIPTPAADAQLQNLISQLTGASPGPGMS